MPLAWLDFSRILRTPREPQTLSAQAGGLTESGPPPPTLAGLRPVSAALARDDVRRMLEFHPLGALVVMIEVPGRGYVPYRVHDGRPGVSAHTLELRVQGALKAVGGGAHVVGTFQSVQTNQGPRAIYIPTGPDSIGYLLPLNPVPRHAI